MPDGTTQTPPGSIRGKTAKNIIDRIAEQFPTFGWDGYGGVVRCA